MVWWVAPADEISEYLAAMNLGLHKWDLFLNLGLAYLEQKSWRSDHGALETAALLGPEHAETHFNLAMLMNREKFRPGAAGNQSFTAPRAGMIATRPTRMGSSVRKQEISFVRKDLWTHLTQVAPD